MKTLALGLVLSVPLAAQTECSPLMTGAVYSYSLPAPYSINVTGMWTQVSTAPGACSGRTLRIQFARACRDLVSDRAWPGADGDVRLR